jgi:CRISPR-associated protein Cas2
MLVLVAYDVNTETREGQRRLRRVAQACVDFGHRVQKSVFECVVGDKELVVLRKRLLDEIDPAKDNLRLYFLDEVTRQRTEQYGVGTVPDMEGPLIV